MPLSIRVGSSKNALRCNMRRVKLAQSSRPLKGSWNLPKPSGVSSTAMALIVKSRLGKSSRMCGTSRTVGNEPCGSYRSLRAAASSIVCAPSRMRHVWNIECASSFDSLQRSTQASAMA